VHRDGLGQLPDQGAEFAEFGGHGFGRGARLGIGCGDDLAALFLKGCGPAADFGDLPGEVGGAPRQVGDLAPRSARSRCRLLVAL